MSEYVELRISPDACLGSDIDIGNVNETHTFEVRYAFMGALIECGNSEEQAAEWAGLRKIGEWSGVVGEYPFVMVNTPD